MKEETVSELAQLQAQFSPDGRAAALVFTNVDGSQFKTGLTGDSFNHFVGVVPNVLADLSSKAKPDDLAGKPHLFTPIQAASVALADSPIESDTILSVQIGAVTISFSIETARLQAMCKMLASREPPRAPRPLN
jgi:hypothetical protein